MENVCMFRQDCRQYVRYKECEREFLGEIGTPFFVVYILNLLL